MCGSTFENGWVVDGMYAMAADCYTYTLISNTAVVCVCVCVCVCVDMYREMIGSVTEVNVELLQRLCHSYQHH